MNSNQKYKKKNKKRDKMLRNGSLFLALSKINISKAMMSFRGLQIVIMLISAKILLIPENPFRRSR